LMTVPLMILGVLSVIGGWIGIPIVMSFGADINFLHHWLAPVVSPGGHGAAGAAEAVHHPSVGLEWALIGLAVATAVVGILVARRIYLKRPGSAEGIAKSMGPIYRLIRNLYWVDELYELVVLRPFYALSRWFSNFDRWVIDGVVNAAGIVTDLAGQVVKLFQTGYVRNYALLFLAGVVFILFYLASI